MCCVRPFFVNIILEQDFMVSMLFMVELITGIKRDKTNRFMEGKVHPCTGTEALYRPYGP
jgi:hypothetical protein